MRDLYVPFCVFIGTGYLGAIHYFFTSAYGRTAVNSRLLGSGGWFIGNVMTTGLVGLSCLIYGLQAPTLTAVSIYFIACFTQLLILVAAPVPESS